MARPKTADNLALAVTAIVVNVGCLSFGDAVFKFFNEDFSFWQLLTLRSLLALGLLLLLVRPTMPLPRSVAEVGWLLLRSFLMVLVWVCFYLALPSVQLSVAASVLYTTPIFITLLSAWLSGDRVTAKSWLAVGLGFVGVLLILRPSRDGFNLYAIFPLFAALFFACAMVMTRIKCREVSTRLLGIAQNGIFLLAGALVSGVLYLWQPAKLIAAQPLLFGNWLALGGLQWGVLALLASIVAISNLCGAFAYQRAPSSVIATFDYTYLIFSLLWGLLLLGETPDAVSLVGMLLIIAAGLRVIFSAK